MGKWLQSRGHRTTGNKAAALGLQPPCIELSMRVKCMCQELADDHTHTQRKKTKRGCRNLFIYIRLCKALQRTMHTRWLPSLCSLVSVCSVKALACLLSGWLRSSTRGNFSACSVAGCQQVQESQLISSGWNKKKDDLTIQRQHY